MDGDMNQDQHCFPQWLHVLKQKVARDDGGGEMEDLRNKLDEIGEQVKENQRILHEQVKENQKVLQDQLRENHHMMLKSLVGKAEERGTTNVQVLSGLFSSADPENSYPETGIQEA